ncbi:Nicotinamide n-methyltransferase [Colletotrichum higginsianum IMI 349063]|uniref:Nicotinamide n-methyltransferase n=1 Tax=Colletotrichum higginsianum (strain IMI 349063) TaxID=759273 RepID=A0A1B7YSC5_COLHI|nr:Nicotinamide n-methyltransferase [Colletotrichum higginsianum IMI 349063]OBR14955.1 Nicotinamide n-methyltransferase [Colletotrichum higginsianum IMI 349063]
MNRYFSPPHSYDGAQSDEEARRKSPSQTPTIVCSKRIMRVGNINEQICEVIENAGIDRADMYVRFYMIGKSEAMAKPTVLICCINKRTRLTATAAVVASLALRTTPKIGLRHAALPLEQPIPARNLASDSSDNFQMTGASLGSWNNDIFAESLAPVVGRALFRSNELDQLSPWSTAGILLRKGKDFCQLTVEHTPVTFPEDDFEDTEVDLSAVSAVNLYDSDDDGDDNNETDDADVSEIDQEALSHASKTPPLSPSCASVTSNTSFDEVRGSSDSQSGFTGNTESSLPDIYAHWGALTAQSRLECLLTIESIPTRRNLVKIGDIDTKASDGCRPGLDYSLISMANPLSDPRYGESLENDKGDYHNLRKSSRRPDGLKRERRVIVFLRRGVTRGVIFAGTTMFKRKDIEVFQRLYMLRLDGVVHEGDCGAAVVDRDTGRIYGHIVRGCPNTGMIYAMPLYDVSQDLQSRGLSLSLCPLPDHISQSQLVSRKLLTKSMFGSGPSLRLILWLWILCSISNLCMIWGIDMLVGSFVPVYTLAGLYTCTLLIFNLWEPFSSGPANPNAKFMFGRYDLGKKLINWAYDCPVDDRSCLDEDSEEGENDIEDDDVDEEEQSDEEGGSVEEEESDKKHQGRSFRGDEFWTKLLEQNKRRMNSAGLLRRFCSGIKLVAFKARESIPPKAAVSLDDRSYNNGEVQTREVTFTAEGLFDELRKENSETFRAPPKSSEKHRRLVSTYGLDYWTAISLVHNCPGVEASALVEGIIRHIYWNASLNSSFLSSLSHSSVSQPFVLECHLPYFVWKSIQATDPRRNLKGTVLRKVRDVSFVGKLASRNCPLGQDFLHQAHTSFIVCVYNRNHWTAYAFEDVYYQDESLIATSNGEPAGSDGLASLDRSQNGSTTIWDPEEFYFKAASDRLAQIVKEWRRVSDHLNERICRQFLLPSRHWGDSESATAAPIKWYRDMDDLLRNLERTLDHTMDAIAAVLVKRHHYFDASGISRISADLIQDIESLSYDLKGIQDTFRRLRNLVVSTELAAVVHENPTSVVNHTPGIGLKILASF